MNEIYKTELGLEYLTIVQQNYHKTQKAKRRARRLAYLKQNWFSWFTSAIVLTLTVEVILFLLGF